jgi:hypothetical protein
MNRAEHDVLGANVGRLASILDRAALGIEPVEEGVPEGKRRLAADPMVDPGNELVVVAEMTCPTELVSEATSGAAALTSIRSARSPTSSTRSTRAVWFTSNSTSLTIVRLNPGCSASSRYAPGGRFAKV